MYYMTTEQTQRFLINDYVIYKSNNLNKHDYQCGKIKNIIKQDEEETLIVELVSLDFCSTLEEDVIQKGQIICNLLQKPEAGVVYNKAFKNPPRVIKSSDNIIKLYIPKSILGDSNNQYDVDTLLKELDEAFAEINNVKGYFADKTYEIIVEEGDYHKSTCKKAKQDFDYTLNLKVAFLHPASIKDSLYTAIAQVIWKLNSPENKSDWIQVFTDELSYDPILSKTLADKFIAFLEGNTKDLEREEEIVCKALCKEIKKVKCLSTAEMSLLLETRGSDYILNTLVPEVANGVKLKNNMRINPLTGVNAQKKFQLSVREYLQKQPVDSQYETVLKLFFD